MPVQGCYQQKMLTRSQVARRIGRSIATVRKMEGQTLHPRVDARGVHRFDAAEVETVARRVAETGCALPGSFPLMTTTRRTSSPPLRASGGRTPHVESLRSIGTLGVRERELLRALADILGL